MSISVTTGVTIPVSVVEVGNEITQDQLNAITAATLPSVSNVFITQSLLTSSLTPYAPLASPTFTGTPTLPTGTIGVTQTSTDNSTKLSTTAFVKAQSYLTTSSASSTYQTISGMSSYLTTSSASTTYAPKASPTFTGTVTIPSGASISGYLTTASASSTYQPIGSYLVDAPSDGSEYVRKNAAWAIVTGGGGSGDRYLTTSTTSMTINNVNKTLTVGTGLSYTPTQSVTISYDASNHMHGEVLTYDSATGVMTVDVNGHTGSGTFAVWTVNVGGVVGAAYLPLTGGTMTGAVDVPQINNILNTDLVIDSYNDTGAGTHYLHKFTPYDGKFVLAPNGGGLTLPDGTVQTTAFVGLSVTNIDLTGNFNGYLMGSGYYSFKYDSTANTLRMQDGVGSGITISPTGITFPNSTTLSTGAKSVNTVTSTYTPQLSDANNIVFLNGGGTAISLSVPEDSTVDFPVGTVIIVLSDDTANGIGQGSAGSPSLNGGSGGSLPNRVTHLVKKGANSWYYT